jgi:hypothetical protein
MGLIPLLVRLLGVFLNILRRCPHRSDAIPQGSPDTKLGSGPQASI